MSRCLKNRTEGLDSEDESRNEQNDQDCLEDVYLWVENIMFSIIIIHKLDQTKLIHGFFVNQTCLSFYGGSLEILSTTGASRL